MTCRDLKAVGKFIYDAFEDRKIMLDSLSTLNDIVDKIDKNTSHAPKIGYSIKDASSDGMRFTIVWNNF